MLDEFRSTSITWDKATRRIYSPITANASDSNGRKLNIQVVNSGQVENLTGATLHLYWETKDKVHDGLDAFDASDISKGEFEIFYTTGMLSNVGELNATLVLVDSTGKVVSDWFKITVTRGINEGAIESENSFSSLTQALIDISNLEQNYAPRLNDLTAQLRQKVNRDEIANGLTAKGSALYASLPTTGNNIGDYYYCIDGDGTNPGGNYVWNGSDWYFGGTGDEGYNIITNKIKDELVEDTNEAGGTSGTGLFKTETKAVYTGIGGKYYELAVSVGEKFRISGHHYNGSYFGYVFLDISNNIIANYVGAVGNFTTDVQAPLHAVKLFVNGYASVVPVVLSVAEKLYPSKAEIAILKSDIADVSLATDVVSANIFDNPFPTDIVVSNGLWRLSTKTVVTDFGGKNGVLSVTAGETYQITGHNYNTDFVLYAFLDDSNNVVDYYNSSVVEDKVDLRVVAPVGATVMYVNGVNANAYRYKRDLYANKERIENIEDEIATIGTEIDTIKSYETNFVNMADMVKRVRAGGKTFSFSGITGGYMSIVFDDGRHDLSTVYDICHEYGIPLSCALPSNSLNVLCDNGMTVKQVAELIVADGGEVLSHSIDGAVLTDAKNYTQIKAMLGQSKEILVNNGFDIRGFIRPGGADAIDWNGNNLQRFTQMYYDYGDIVGDTPQYRKYRVYLGNTPIADAKALADTAVSGNLWTPLLSHTLDGTDYNLSESYFREFIEYALSVGVTFTTYRYMYDTFGTWT